MKCHAKLLFALFFILSQTANAATYHCNTRQKTAGGKPVKIDFTFTSSLLAGKVTNAFYTLISSSAHINEKEDLDCANLELTKVACNPSSSHFAVESFLLSLQGVQVKMSGIENAPFMDCAKVVQN